MALFFLLCQVESPDTIEGMKNLLSKIFLLLLLICLSTSAWGQKSTSNVTDTLPAKKKFDWNKVFIGGGLGLQFGTITLFDISPLIGYRFTDRMSAGIGVTYQYYRYKDKFIDFTTNVYGGRLFGRYLITENLFAHAEYEVLSLETFDYLNNRINVVSVLVGGGYRQPIGSYSYLNLMILWNLNESAYSPYINPIIRIGVNIGL